MLYQYTGKVSIAQELDFRFPQTPCCNCGTSNSLSILEQDTRQTNFLGLGGTELTFKFPLPFCVDCAASAKRRPKNLFHRALIFLVVFGVVFLGLVILGDVVFSIPALAQYVTLISLAVAFLVTILLITMNRPKGRQTSYFQPVRIKKLKRDFLSGTIKGIRFGFTNKEYARAFYLDNKIIVDRKLIEITAA